MSTGNDEIRNKNNIGELKSPTLKNIRDAARNIASKAIKTPLVPLNYNNNLKDEKGSGVCTYYYNVMLALLEMFNRKFIPTILQGVTPKIYLKLENLQPIGSFKVRPAANAIACIEDKDRLRKAGVCTASAGNFAQGKSYCICNSVRRMASKNSSEWYIYL